ncbi:hypothetical protein Bca4012_071854 [Brassica carinata]
MLECVGGAFTTTSDSRKIITKSDVEVQISSTKTTEAISIASSGPVETATQEYKLMKILKQTLGNESEETPLSIEKGYGDEIFSSREEEDRNRTDPGEPTCKNFTQAENNTIRTKGVPVNPPEILNTIAKPALK